MMPDQLTLDRVRVLRASERFPHNGEWELATLHDLVEVLEGIGAKRLKAWVELMDGRMAIPLDDPGTYLVMRLEHDGGLS